MKRGTQLEGGDDGGNRVTFLLTGEEKKERRHTHTAKLPAR